jgi:hypothetical protein
MYCRWGWVGPGWVREISHPPGFNSRIVHPVASRYTDNYPDLLYYYFIIIIIIITLYLKANDPLEIYYGNVNSSEWM